MKIFFTAVSNWGTASKLSGGSFANGAQTGAFQQLFKETVHQEHGAWPQDETHTTGHAGFRLKMPAALEPLAFSYVEIK